MNVHMHHLPPPPEKFLYETLIMQQKLGKNLATRQWLYVYFYMYVGNQRW